ncbi:hypothetical protein QBC40DRAFT_346778 [Triangularia verruculosa]|uniref:Uncharacterized protein n=1 Tax=Triangularia verruculosa TaxID=2587418 RepID=A0AAN7AZF5_9PEZI|nr:hypothetical protein QBC40DRAFT_346778 [Triangularia verruculosa]
MSSTTQPIQSPQPQQAPEQPAPGLASKRPAADDEVEFISSCPVKRPRPNDQKPDPAVSQPQPQDHEIQPRQQPPGNGHHASGRPCSTSSATTTANVSSSRSESMQVPSQNSTPDLGFEHHGPSLSALDNFAFPQNFLPLTCPSRMSIAISPKQTPQAMPSASHSGPMLADTSVPSHCNPTPGLDQVPCLDFNGITTNGAGFEMVHVFPPSDNNVPMNNTTVMASQMMNPTPSGPNAIPFTMYSMGSIMPMHQQNVNPNANTWMNPRPTQVQTSQAFRQNNVPMTVKEQQQQPQQASSPTTPQAAPVQPRYSLSLHTPSQNQSQGKPPCLHCTVLRQEHIRRHQQPPHSHDCQPPPPHNCQPPPAQPSMPLPFTTQTFQPALPAPTTRPAPTTSTFEQQTLSSKKSKFSIPTRKRPTQNLQVDIAETAEEIFPYDEVAARHGVTPQKVFDTLSAIVLIPLLRCPTDKRRAGKLAHERGKQLTQLKNDMGKEKGEVATVKEVRDFLGEENRQQAQS